MIPDGLDFKKDGPDRDSPSRERGIDLILQPPGSSLCGQSCVAMAAGISLEESIGVFGHHHSTKTREIVRAIKILSFRGIDCPQHKLKRFKKGLPWPHRAIISEIWWIKGKDIHWLKGKRKGHWVLLWDGKIYDPDPHEEKGKYSSYLEICST